MVYRKRVLSDAKVAWCQTCITHARVVMDMNQSGMRIRIALAMKPSYCSAYVLLMLLVAVVTIRMTSQYHVIHHQVGNGYYFTVVIFLRATAVPAAVTVSAD